MRPGKGKVHEVRKRETYETRERKDPARKGNS